MAVARRHSNNVRSLWSVVPGPLQVGTVSAIDPSGCALVDYQGNVDGPRSARTTIQVRSPAEIVGAQILLAFEGADITRPVIVGVLYEQLLCEPLAAPTPLAGRALDVVVDGRHVQLEAQEELQLRCGKGSITLTKDGRIVAKGTDIVSRAARSQKIKGASVNIN